MSQSPVLVLETDAPLVVVVSPVVLVAGVSRRATVVLSLASSGLFAGWGPRLN